MTAEPVPYPIAGTRCPGCWGSKPPVRWACLACEQVLPAPMALAVARTTGRPITDHERAVALAEALTWLRVRRERRHL